MRLGWQCVGNRYSRRYWPPRQPDPANDPGHRAGGAADRAELFTALLGTGEVAGRYRSAAAVAAERGERLRVVVRIDSPLLASLPWEAMYDQALGGYVCRHEQLVRHVPVPSLPAPLQVDLPLRVLGVVSSPLGLAPLDTDRERDPARACAGTPGP